MRYGGRWGSFSPPVRDDTGIACKAGNPVRDDAIMSSSEEFAAISLIEHSYL